MMALRIFYALAALAAFAPGLSAFAQAKPPAADKPAPSPAPATAPGAVAIPDAYRLNLLIRTTIIALNQANVTGNYSVLRDLAAPGFQSANNPARLGEIFAELRRRNFDLSPILFADPKLVRPASIEPNGLLRLSGFIPTRPQQVDFDMMFQFVGGAWRLFGLAVDTRTVVEAPSSETPSSDNKPVAAGAAPTVGDEPKATAAGNSAKAAADKPAAKGATTPDATKAKPLVTPEKKPGSQ
jgi:hypothetical protein